MGTSEKVATFVQEKTKLIAGQDFFVAHCPERVLPGNIFHELVYNDRIIGGINESSTHAAKLLYKPFVRGCLYLTNAKTAEMVKLIENSSRDVSIAFAHQVASMAQTAGINPYEVIDLANYRYVLVGIFRAASDYYGAGATDAAKSTKFQGSTLTTGEYINKVEGNDDSVTFYCDLYPPTLTTTPMVPMEGMQTVCISRISIMGI